MIVNSLPPLKVSIIANFFCCGPPLFNFRIATDYISDLVWSRLCVEPAEILEVAENPNVFRDLLVMLPTPTLREQKRVCEND